ncbi:MAG: MBL fold metallo-hydrolase [Fimbriimonadaceae bacterium]|nr:MBL fold metallo-hydrolase [Fimbriimonadaceae bacterium]
MTIKRLYDDALAQATYIVGCGATGEAIVIDPSLDLAPVIETAKEEGFKIVAVTETHIHADYVSGSKPLAEATGATLYLSGEGAPDWQYDFADQPYVQEVHDGDVISVGNLSLQVLHTPGHTPEHIAFLLTDLPASDGPVALFSGDLLFVGDVGRPDLLEKAAGIEGTMRAGAETLHASLGALAELPPELLVWPAHGSGSACGKALGGSPVTTIGYEQRTNWAFLAPDRAAFVDEVLSGQPEPPLYFAEMKRVNKAGPAAMPAMPERLAGSSLAGALDSGFVVDTRPRSEAEATVVAGAVTVPFGRQFPTWVGSLFGPGDRIVLLARDDEAADQAAKWCASVGNLAVGWIPTEEALAAAAEGGLLLPTPKTATGELPAALAAEGGELLDVRKASEVAEGFVAGTRHLPLARLSALAEGLPAASRLHVHCASGMRALVAASYLRAKGFDARAVTAPFEAVRAEFPAA